MTETIREYVKLFTDGEYKGNPFFDALHPYNTPVFIKDGTMQTDITNTMILLYGDYLLRSSYRDDPKQIPMICSYMYSMDTYRYEGLYNSTQLDYNPIENYRMTEKGKDSNSGTDITTYNKGQQINNDNLGSRHDVFSNGKQESNLVHSVAPYETSSFKNESQDHTTVESYTQNSDTGEQSNNFTEGAREDDTKLTHGLVTDHELTRSGNIGVTTSQQMIESERKLRNMSIVKIICADLVKYLCDRVSY